MKKQQLLAILAAAVGYSIFGFSFLTTRIAADIASPLLLLALRNLTAWLMLNILLLCRAVKFDLRKKGIWKLFLTGLCQPVLYALAETYGIGLTGSAVAGSIIATSTIFSMLFAVFFIGEPFQPTQFLFAAGSVVGVCMITLPGAVSGGINLLGVFLLLAAALFSALYNILSKKLADTFSPFERTYIMFFTGSIIFSALTFAENKSETLQIAASCLKNPQFLLCLLFLAIFSSVIAFLLINFSFSRISVRQTAVFSSLTTVISAAAGVVLLKESLSIIEICGIAVILICVYKVGAMPDTEAALHIKSSKT